MATVKNWHALDSTQRTSFANSAPTYERQDSLGNTYQFTGVQLQNSVNQNLHLVSLPPQSTGNDYVAPMVFTISGGGANLFPVTLEISISPNTIPAGYLVLVSLTPVGLYPFPAFPPNELRQVLALDPGVYGVIDLLPAYEMQFGDLIPDAGQNIVVAVQSFNTATGIKSDHEYIVLFFT